MIGAKETHNRYISQLEHEFEGLAAGPAWLQEIREHAMRRFVELDFPTTKQEAWKYTNVSAIANSAFPLSPAAGLSDLDIEAVRELMPGRRRAARLVFVDGRFNSALSY